LRNTVSAFITGEGLSLDSTVRVQEFKLTLAEIDKKCIAERTQRAAMGPAAGGTVVAPPLDIVAQAQDPKFVVAATGGDIPWWLWFVGGAALYLIFGKKGKK
jgi:hypothetical protein